MNVDLMFQMAHMQHTDRLARSRRGQWIRQLHKEYKAQGGEWRLDPAGLLWTGAVLLVAVMLLA